MRNRIDELLTKLKHEQGMSVPEFAEKCGLPKTTVYNARKREDMGSITVDVFLKIAHGLGMTAEELYYGEEGEPKAKPSDELTNNERRVMDVYRADRRTRRTIDHAVSDYLEDVEDAAREKKEVV